MTAVDPSSMNVPRELVEALREAATADFGNVSWLSVDARTLINAVNRLLAAAEPKCPKCGTGTLSTSGGRTPLKCIRASCNHVVGEPDLAPVPVSDEAEAPIVTPRPAKWCGQSQPHAAHVWEQGQTGWYTDCSGHA